MSMGTGHECPAEFGGKKFKIENRNRLLRFGGKKFKIEIDSSISIWREEIQNRNRLLDLAGRNSK
jgi:CRISPR/Cas system-associated protein Cas5 (RAMP superfamily)